MKDKSHHMKNLNRKVIRSINREEGLEKKLPEVPTWESSEREKRKKIKRANAKKRKERAPKKKTVDERNQILKKGRVPVLRESNHKISIK